MTNPTLKEQVEEILEKDEGVRSIEDVTVEALLTLITADRKAHSEAMVGAIEDKYKAMPKSSAVIDRVSPSDYQDGLKAALIAGRQASARYQEGEGI